MLLNVRSLEPRAIANLESFVKEGGGLAVWLGGNQLSDADIQRFNRDWFRDGKGLLPTKILGIQELPALPDGSSSPDMIADPHPIFTPLLGLSNSPFQFVRISKYVMLDRVKKKQSTIDGKDVSDGTSSVVEIDADRDNANWQSIARLRTGTPWITDHTLAKDM